MRRLVAGLAIAALVPAGCGSNVNDPGDPQARRVHAFAAHGRSIDARLGGAARALLTGVATPRETRLVLSELLSEATLLHEDVAATVPLGVPGRTPTLDGARELVDAGRFMYSYASGHQDALPLARAHLAAGTRALASP